MNNDIQENQEKQNYKDMEAEVLGELRKEKIGKPILVFEIFGFLLLVLIAIPIVTGMLENENSFLYKLVYKEDTPSPSKQKEEFQDALLKQPLTYDTVSKFDTVIMKRFSLSDNLIKFTIYSRNGLANLNQENYYMEITSSSDAVLGYIKLTGAYDFQEKEVSFSIPDFHINSNLIYYGKVYKMADDDYPKVKLETDTNGIGKLTCVKDYKTMVYTFKNDYLIKIKETSNAQSIDDIELYNQLKKTYENKKDILKNYSMIEFSQNGFKYSSDIDLEAPGFMLPDNLNDYDYYPLDTQVKLISYSQKGKGFECK